MISKEQLSAMTNDELEKELEEREKEFQKIPVTFSKFTGQLGDEISDIQAEQKRRLIDDFLKSLD